MECEFVIIGGGMVGLAIANQLIDNNYSKNIIILDKESKLGLHSSGRNSGVLHAGIYYEPKSLKAKVSVEGAKRLKEWIIKRNLRINSCFSSLYSEPSYSLSVLTRCDGRSAKGIK